MRTIVNDILEQLGEDMVSHGWLVQSVEQEDAQLDWKTVLAELLSEDVEVGDTRVASPDYVEFIAWKGTIEERVSKAIGRLNSLSGHDREFAYWLALRKNVDRFEGEGSAA
jgi:hypothetical protein